MEARHNAAEWIVCVDFRRLSEQHDEFQALVVHYELVDGAFEPVASIADPDHEFLPELDAFVRRHVHPLDLQEDDGEGAHLADVVHGTADHLTVHVRWHVALRREKAKLLVVVRQHVHAVPEKATHKCDSKKILRQKNLRRKQEAEKMQQVVKDLLTRWKKSKLLNDLEFSYD